MKAKPIGKSVRIDLRYHSEMRAIRGTHGKNRRALPSLQYLTNRAIGLGMDALKQEVLKGLAAK